MSRFKKLFARNEYVDVCEEVNIIVDTKTGVNYLVYTYDNINGIGTGLTVLVDKDGKPVITK